MTCARCQCRLSAAVGVIPRDLPNVLLCRTCYDEYLQDLDPAEYEEDG